MGEGPAAMALNLQRGASSAPFNARRGGGGAHESVADLRVAAEKALVRTPVILLADPCLVGDLIC